MPLKPKRLSRNVIYESPWVNVYADRVQYPNGDILEKHHVLDFPTAAVATIVTNEQDAILMIRAIRYVTDSVGWEIPAGGMEPGETSLEAARREVLEETGYESEGHTHLGCYYPSNGISNQTFHVIRCKATSNSGQFDTNEVQEVRWMSTSEIKTMIRERKLSDGFSLTALLLHLFDTETG